MRGSRVGIFGVSYKPGVGDLRESPALRIIRLLRERGAEIVYHDEFVPELPEHGLRSRVARGRGLRGDRDRASRASTWSAWCARRRSSSTSAA